MWKYKRMSVTSEEIPGYIWYCAGCDRMLIDDENVGNVWVD